MSDRRRRSPTRPSPSSRQSRPEIYEEPERMRNDRAPPSPSLSSSSSSYLDISRTYPNTTGNRIRTFFTAPSERRRLRKRRSTKLFRFGKNESSSSVNSDLAYGTGFIKRNKSQRRGVRRRDGTEREDRAGGRKNYDANERYMSDNGKKGYTSGSERYTSDRERRRRDGTGSRNGKRASVSNLKTEAEILALGAGLAKIARDQNKLDLKNARNGRRPESGAGAVGGFSVPGQSMPGQSMPGQSSRGLGPSKISHGSGRVDEDGWETSDGESAASVDSRLAYGNDSTSRWNFFGKKKMREPLSRKESIVDPNLFGPANSLQGIVTKPVGFGQVSPWASNSDFGQRGDYVQSLGSASTGIAPTPLKTVDPRPMSETSRPGTERNSVVPGQYSSSRPPRPVSPPRTDRSRFETDQYSSSRPRPVSPPRADRSSYGPSDRYSSTRPPPVSPPKRDQSRFDEVRDSAASGSQPYVSTRPAPIVIQEPQPITPVSQKMYDSRYERSEAGSSKKAPSSSGRSKSLAEAALVGVAGTAAIAALNSSREERKEKERRRDEKEELDKQRVRREREKEDFEKERFARRDSERRQTKDDRQRDQKSSPIREDRSERDKRKQRERARDDTDEKRRQKKREKSRDEPYDEKEEKRGSRSSRESHVSKRSNSETAMTTTAVDPFQYQVAQDSFPTPPIQPVSHGHRDSVPTVVTVEREPNFAPRRSSPTNDNSYYESRSAPQTEYDWDEGRSSRPSREIRDHALDEAKEVVRETKHFTGPYEPAVIGAAIGAIIHEDEYRKAKSKDKNDERHERGRTNSCYEESRDKPPVKERDPIQEAADRDYRERVMAQKIAEQYMRSRSPSPERSMEEKYKDVVEQIPVISTPPGMEEHKQKGLFDAPNADFQLDHILAHPVMLRNFSISENEQDHSGWKRDLDASRPRPFLNLVCPTPEPEKQVVHEEESRQSRSTEKESTSRDRSPSRSPSRRRPAPIDVIIGPKGDIIPSPVASPTTSFAKGVTWGENETKHYEIESPAEQRDDFISSSEDLTRNVPVEPRSSDKPKSKGWGAIAAGIMGAGAGVAMANSGDSTKTSTAKDEVEEQSPAPYEYRGVIVEPDSTHSAEPRKTPSKDRSASLTDPVSTRAQSSHIPGAFDDDLDFTAHVAAGLEHTGFDPNIVIDDPTFHKRDSPPGSNEHGIYRAPFAETVTDLGHTQEVSVAGDSHQGYVLGEVAATPQDWTSVSPAAGVDDTPQKLTKKEQKKRDKERRQSSEVSAHQDPPESTSRDIVEEPEDFISKKEQKKRDRLARQVVEIPPTPSVAEEIVEEPESYFETPKKSKKKSKRSSTYDEDNTESPRTVSVPVDAYDDLQNGEDEWAETKKSKKKSKRDSERHESPMRSISEVASETVRSASKKSKRDSERNDSPTRSVAASDGLSEWERSSSKASKRDEDRYGSPTRSIAASEATTELGRSSSRKSKDHSKRKSERYEPSPSEISLPPSTPSEVSREGDFEDIRMSRKSSIRDSADRGHSRSVVSAGTSRYDEEDETPRKHRKKSRSQRDDDDTRSVASAPAGNYDDKKSKKDKKSGGFFGLFGSKSEVGSKKESSKESKDNLEETKRSKKSKRMSMPDSSSLYGDLGAVSVGDLSRSVSNGHSNGHGHHDHDEYEDGTRSDGEHSEKRKKSHSRSQSVSSKKDSFLDNTGTLGAGAGIAGAAVAIVAHHHQQSNADQIASSSEATKHTSSPDMERGLSNEDLVDPEVMERPIRPSFDPLYGDLLLLPPSVPASPKVDLSEDFPELPESRPDTPEAERNSRINAVSTVRKSLQDTPIRSPSQSAVPVALRFSTGDRSAPSSPGAFRPSPIGSPAGSNQRTLEFPRTRQNRPTSWDSAREYMPLYLVETNRRGSATGVDDHVAEQVALPLSQSTSRSSSLADFERKDNDYTERLDSQRSPKSLSIDTTHPASVSPFDFLDSEQSTPKAAPLPDSIEQPISPLEASNEMDFPDLPSHKTIRSSTPPDMTDEDIAKAVAGAIFGAGAASSIGYFASSPSHKETKQEWLEDLPSAASVDPVTKDRSSYLLRSSPLSKMDKDSPSGIQTRDLHNGSPTEPRYVEAEREKALESLSGEPHAGMEQGLELLPAVVNEPEELSFPKSKKDKKKDKKKKMKGLSKSSTFDEPTASENSIDIDSSVANEDAVASGSKSQESLYEDVLSSHEPSHAPSHESSQDTTNVMSYLVQDDQPDVKREITEAPHQVEDVEFKPNEVQDPSLELSKDPSQAYESISEKPSAIPDVLSFLDTNDQPVVSHSTPTAVDVEPIDTQHASSEPDKTISQSHESSLDKSPMVPDVVSCPDTYNEAESPLPVMSREVADLPAETQVASEAEPTEEEPIEEYSLPKSKKDKKKDKKKKQSFVDFDKAELAEQPESSVSEIMVPEPSKKITEDVAAPADVGIDDEYSTPSKSKKDKKKDKKKQPFLAFDEVDIAELPERSVSETVVPDSSNEITENVLEDVAAPADVEIDDEFSLPSKSKKDKKKDKKKRQSFSTFDEAEPDEQTEFSMPEAPIPEVTREADEYSLAENAAAVQNDPVEEFITSSKSKKDKKKDKKNKSTSWKPTEEESAPHAEVELEPESEPIDETSWEMIDEPSAVVTPESVESFSTSKSKKGSKRNKKASKLASGELFEEEVTPQAEPEPEPIFETSREIVEETSTIEASEPVDELFTSKSKKDKKKKRKSITWDDPIEAGPSGSQTSPILDASRNLSKESESTTLPSETNIETEPIDDDFATPKSKKDKKKRKSISWEDPIEVGPSGTQAAQIVDNPRDLVSELETATPLSSTAVDTDSHDTSPQVKIHMPIEAERDLFDEPPVLDIAQDDTNDVAPTESSVATETVPADDFSKPKSKKDKKKRKSISWEDPVEVESPSLQEEVIEPSQDIIDTPSAIHDAEASRDIVDTPSIIPEIEPTEPSATDDTEPVDYSSVPRPKKDKKKGKNKGKSAAIWEPEEDDVPEVTTPIAETSIDIREGTTPLEEATPISRELVEEPLVVADSEPIDAFPISKSKKGKKDKKKGKSAAIWEPEEDNIPEITTPVAETSQDIPEDSTLFEEATPISRELVEEPLVAADSEPVGDISISKFKKGKKKDKKKGKSTAAWKPEETVTEEDSGDFVESTQATIEPPPLEYGIAIDHAMTEHVTEPATESIENSAIPVEYGTSRDQEIAENTIDTAENLEDFATPVGELQDESSLSKSKGNKKKDKKKNKSSASWETEEPTKVEFLEQLPETPQESSDVFETPLEQPVEDNFFSKSKKDKKKDKKRGKSTSIWEPEKDDILPGSSQLETSRDITNDPTSPLVRPETQTFYSSLETPTSYELERSGFVPDVTSRELSHESFKDEPATVKQSSPEDIALPDDLQDDLLEDLPQELPQSKDVTDHEYRGYDDEKPMLLSLPEQEEPLPTSTPQDFHDAEEYFTPTSKKKSKKSKKSKSLPFEEDLPEEREHPSEEPDPKNESLTSAFLPVATIGAAAGAAAFGADTLEKDFLGDKHSTNQPETISENIQGLHSEAPPTEPEFKARAPDGLEAGYQEDQLSLARQLQAEFGSGLSSVKSKKNKKKRQSLPSTPEAQSSRSRTVDDLVQGHPRARSLSIGPIGERDDDSPASAERKNVYSEDQLELARQLKADFRSKSSKKDKKKRQSLSRADTQDDSQAVEDFQQQELHVSPPAATVPGSEVPEPSPRGDGFAAGFQEDQLSLARQLQAEFSRKSKKDKKGRSSSQTPRESGPRDDYFGERSSPLGSKERSRSEGPAILSESPRADEFKRDGLQVGYNEDQLELARQLKEEFGSGSKKDKKGKKRQSLLRSNTEDDFSSDIARDTDEPSVVETPPPETLEGGGAEDDFSSVSKKSKKGKKGNKRESLLRSTTDNGFLSDAIPKSAIDIEDHIPALPDVASEQPTEPIVAGPPDDFTAPVKKSKKDKKGKKRESLLRSTTDDEFSSDVIPKSGVELEDNIPALTDDVSEQPNEPIVAEPQDDFQEPVKKSKKDKKGKKRENLLQATADDEFSVDDLPKSAADSGDEISFLTEAISKQPDETPVDEYEDSFKTSSKKSKKGKKSKKLEDLSTEAVQDPAPSDDVTSRDLNTTLERSTEGEPEAHLSTTLEDNMSFSSKKSKKDKKKRQSTLTQQEPLDQPDYVQKVPSNEPSNADVITVVSSASQDAREPTDDFEIPSKKSKKDKKKRGNLLQSSTFEETSEPQTEDTNVQSESEPQSHGGEIAGAAAATLVGLTAGATLLAHDQDDGLEGTLKKSKKTKRKSLQQYSVDDEVTRDLEELPVDRTVADEDLEATKDALIPDAEVNYHVSVPDEHAAIEEPVTETGQDTPEDSFGGYSLTSKKSKKDKKKWKESTQFDSEDPSETSTPLESASEHKSAIETTSPLDNNAETIPLETSQEYASEIKSTIEEPLPQEDTANKSLSETSPEPYTEQEIMTEAETVAPTDEWDIPSSKKSKKNKKTRKDSSKLDLDEPSGTSTPPPVPELTKEVIEPEETSREFVGEPAEDWASTGKRSKKDKKKRKDLVKPESAEVSGISTPLESTANSVDESNSAPVHTLEAEPSLQESASTEQPLEREVNDIVVPEKQEVVEEPEDWSLPSKKSKKDKKKRKSGPSTPIGDIVAAQPESTHIEESAERDILGEEASYKSEEIPEAIINLPEESVNTETTQVENEEDEWSMPAKKSKKDKKKRKSGLSTPIEDPVTSEPKDPSWDDIDQFTTPVDPSLSSNKVGEPVFSDEPTFRDEPTFKDEHVVKEEPASEDEPILKEKSTSRDEHAVNREPILKDESAFEDEPTFSDEPTLTVKSAIKEEPAFEDEPTIRDESTSKDEPAQTEIDHVLEEPIEHDAAPHSFSDGVFTQKSLTSESAKTKDIVEDSSEHTKLPSELPLEIDFSQEKPSSKHAIDTKEPVEEPAEKDWASFSTKESKKHKSGLSTPTEEPLPVMSEPESLGLPVYDVPGHDISQKIPDPSEAAETKDVDEPFEEFPSKKSKKDKKKRKSGLSTPIEEVVPTSSEHDIPTHELLYTNPDITQSADVHIPTETRETEEPLEEFAMKRSKKDKKKRKSGFSTPIEETIPAEAEPSTIPLSISQAQSVAGDEPFEEYDDQITHQGDGVSTPTETKEVEEPFEAFPVKKSKKDKKKKRQSGMSTPNDWTPAFESEPTAVALPVTEERSCADEQTSDQPLEAFELPKDISMPAETESIEEPSEEFSVKKSKKDKKKRKSGFSTPVEEAPSLTAIPAALIVAEEQPTTEKIELVKHDRPLETLEDAPGKSEERALDETLEPISISTEASNDEKDSLVKRLETGIVDPAEEDAGAPVENFVPKKSKKDKKDKKKAKSGSTTLIEEATFSEPFTSTVDGSEKDSPRDISVDAFVSDAHDTTARSQPLEKKHGIEAESSSFNDPEERGTDEHSALYMPTEFEKPVEQDALDEFASTTKKSKKDKKGRKASRSSSNSGPSTSNQSITSTDVQKPIDSVAGSTIPGRLVASPVPLEEEATEYSREFTEHDQVPVTTIKDAPTSLSRKSSKKEKRKRQATATSQGSNSIGQPLFPDEVEEAEVERKLPIIEDIAKDESLSHIASTTEQIPMDDFVRPTKKGKKGKKGGSGTVTSVSSMESFRPPIGDDIPREERIDHGSNHLPAFAAIGAGLAGAALVGKVMESHEAARPPLERKLSKKEKRKMSIDRRTPRDDVFDDDALWEGAEPKSYEEDRIVEDENESDGFWSPEKHEVEDAVVINEDKHEEGHEEELTGHKTRREAYEEDPSSHTARTEPNLVPSPISEEPQQHSNLEERSIGEEAGFTPDINNSPPLESEGSRNLSESAEHHLPSDYVEMVHEEKEQTLQPAIAYEEVSLQKEAVLPISEPQIPSHSVELFSSNDREILFAESPTLGRDHISHPTKDLAEQLRADKNFHEAPSTPLSSSRYGFWDLPVVHEETPVQIEDAEPGFPTHTYHEDANRDSGFVGDSPIPPQRHFADNHEHVRDSGVHMRDSSPSERTKKPAYATDDALARMSWPSVDEETETVDLHRSQRPSAGSTKKEERRSSPLAQNESHSKERRTSPLGSTPKAHRSARRSPEGDDSLASLRARRSEEKTLKHRELSPATRNLLPSQRHKAEQPGEVHKSPVIHQARSPQGSSLVKQRLQQFETPDQQRTARRPKEDKYADLTPSTRPKAERPTGASELELGAAIAGASLGFAAARQLSAEKRPDSAQSQRSVSNINRLRTPDIRRPDSVTSNRSMTPPLRRSTRQLSGDLRSLSQQSKPDLAKEAELAAITSSSVNSANTSNPTANEGRVRAKDMADVYDGFGEGRMGSPRSPTRPHSMRRRQSMQVLDLESKVEQLIGENRRLAEEKAHTDLILQSTSQASSSLVEKNAEIDSLKRTLDWLQHEVTRLTEVNDGLQSANATIGRQHGDRYGMLEIQHAQATRELQDVRDAHNSLSQGHEGTVQEKDREIAQLRAELDAAKGQIREMQRQILASKASDSEFLTIRDEDYFDNACQQLCQHVQQWVLRFSKFSDMRACRLTSEINNDKTIDRLDNAILDGSDVDTYLSDRVKRRDVFMSMTMAMVWEFIFTRYLFGMDREQRQKLKSLEKTLSEVGPPSAVHQWRATTLTLLAKRAAFETQKEQDTQAVVHAIIETLSEILPPPSNLESQIEEQLTRVMKAAVDLSIEMRCQRAEYMMLPPLQPEYDANGDPASKVTFNAALMNERSGDTVSNENLETQKAVVRIVLFPLVVKKGDDSGDGDEEIVVCPAQVLVAKPKKTVRLVQPGEGVDNRSRVSMQSNFPMTEAGEENVI